MTKTPAILLVAWRRPDTIRRVLASCRCVAPKQVFVACDGPEFERGDEVQKVLETRQIIDSEIDWNCDIYKLYSDVKQGCRLGVSRAVTWFLENVEEGIILEDDCVPHPDFFSYASLLLERYRNDRRIMCITGNNFQGGRRRGAASYYFSKYPHCWGWATWRRAWKQFSPDFEFWPTWKRSKDWRDQMKDSRERRHWEAVFDKVYAGQTDSWAQPWMASVWRAGGLTATPQVNMVTNIGFGAEATHTKQSGSRLSIPSEGLGNCIVSPGEIRAHEEADRFVFEAVFARKAAKGKTTTERVKDGLRRVTESAASFHRRLRRA